MAWLQSLFAIRGKVPHLERLALGIVLPAMVLALWFILTLGAPEARILSPVILPSPFEILGQIKSLWFEAELSRSAVMSFIRVMEGFWIGWAIALPVGISMGTFGRAKALFEPSSIFLSYLPIPALVPLTMSMFGIGELQKVAFLALAFAIYLIPLIAKAVEEVDTVFLQTAYTLGANRFATLYKVIVPIAAPGIVHAMRLGFGVGWTYIILAEMVAAERGLGQIIIIAQRRGPREHIYLTLIAIILIAWVTDRAWAWIYKSLFPYKISR